MKKIDAYRAKIHYRHNIITVLIEQYSKYYNTPQKLFQRIKLILLSIYSKN